MRFDLVESMVTISGEAPIAGVPVFLVRFSGCNLACRFCDTPYRDEVNGQWSRDELIAEIQKTRSDRPGIPVLFTGGEPLLGDRGPALTQVMKRLPDVDFYIETNGTILPDGLALPHVHYVVDWKPPSAGCDIPFEPRLVPALRSDRDVIKLVLAASDLSWAEDRIREIRAVQPELPIFLSAQWGDLSLERLAAFIIDHRLPAAMSVQLHKIIWDPDTRGV